MLGSFAKAWNYEGEVLLRQQKDIDYTIIRPGVMSEPEEDQSNAKDDEQERLLALGYNGYDLPVTPIRHSDIADLCIECLDYPNTARATLSAMKMKAPKTDDEEEQNQYAVQGEISYRPLLAGVEPDTRDFPSSLMDEYRKGVRKGVIVLSFVLGGLVAGSLTLMSSFSS